MSTETAPEAPTFDQMPLTPEVRRALVEMGFTSPTPVQAEGYAPITSGSDLIVQARTGTGKTAGFGIPLVDKRVTPGGGVQALILAPTRELALQSSKEISRIGVHRGVRTTAIYGGAPFDPQVRALNDGVEIVSGTPGRVLDHLHRGTLDASKISVLVLDEADEMLSMGFAKELHSIVELLPTQRQTLLFSATVADDVQLVARRYMREPEFLTLSSDQVGAEGISHFMYFVSGAGRAQDLVRILEIEDPESAVVFCNTKAETEQVAQALVHAGFNADWLNGDLPQNERERVMARTRKGELRYLVATDVAARGIDISHLTHVINYTFPPDIAQYIHRSGRTGRAGRTGTAISLVSPHEIGSLYYLRLQYKIFPVERSLPSKNEERTRKEADRVAMLLGAFDKDPGDIDRAVAERVLTHVDAVRIVGGLVRTFFGTEPEATVDEAAAASRRSRRPDPVPDEDAKATDTAPRERRERRPRGEDRPRRERDRDRDRDRPRRDANGSNGTAPEPQRALAFESSTGDAPAPAGSDDSFGGDEGDSEFDDSRPRTKLYMNIGKRDGARAGALSRLLRDQCGLEREQIGRIRVRDKHTFIEVEPARADHVVQTLSGTQFEGRDLVVEHARTESAHP